MKAKQIMTASVECIPPGISIREAAQKMKDLDVGFLPVCENDRLIGAVTDRDIVLRLIAEGRDVKECKAVDAMTHDVFWCFEDQTGDQVADFMAKKEIRRALVLNSDKRLVGVITVGDLAKVQGEQKKVGETIKEIAEAPPAQVA